MATALVGTLIGAVGAEAGDRRRDATVVYALTALFGVWPPGPDDNSRGRRAQPDGGPKSVETAVAPPASSFQRSVAPLAFLGGTPDGPLERVARPQFLTASGITTAEFGAGSG